MLAWRCTIRWMAVACWLVGALPSQAQPAAAFFGPAKLQGAALSPSGRWLAAMTSVPNRRIGFLILDLEGKQESRFVEASPRDDAVWFQWVNDDWIVFSVYDPEDRRTYGYGAGLMSMKRDGSESRMLIAREYDPGDPFRKRRELDPNHRFMRLGAPGTTEVIVGEDLDDVRGDYAHTTLKALDVTTGATRSVEREAPRASGWWFDAKGRARVTSHNNGGKVTLSWADKSGAWREIAKADQFDLPFWPMYVEGDDTLVVTTSDLTGANEFRHFDFTSNKPAAEVMLATPGFDGPAAPYRLRDSGTVIGLRLAVDTATTVWFSPTMDKIQALVDAKLPGHVNDISCVPCDNPRVVLIHSYSAVDPGSYVLYRPQEGRWQLIGQVRPDIEPERMARLSFHRTKARDGLDLPVWVTRPAQASASTKAAPAVVLVHGGPWIRGTRWSWDAEAQFLASRGYVVIQPEFRGSTGYGENHHRAGWKQWGQAMQNDVTDALRFGVAQGWVDASRVCIMGASYGGYATLMGLAKDPDQYRCGVALGAVSDPRFMFEFHWNDIDRDGKSFSLPVMLGDPKADDAMLAANSPLVQAHRIKSPLLLVHGGVDRRVPIQNAERMRDALRKSGKDFELVVYADEGHGFKYVKNELDYWRRVEAFLAKHLGQPK